MCNAFGIVNFEGPDVRVSGLEDYRPAGAFSFLGRYRLIDFPLSNMTNSGIDHIEVFVKNKQRSLIEHLGTGRHYNINSKRGKLHILPVENCMQNDFYNHDIASYMYNMSSIEEVDWPYVIIAPSHMIFRHNFSDLLSKHIESGADVTMLYHVVDTAKETCINCSALNLNKQKGVLSIEKNRGNYKSRNISMETYVLSKDLFIDLVKKAANTSSLYSFKDIINDECSELDIRAIAHKGFFACINDFKSYYRTNMNLIDYEVAMELFSDDWPFYTRTNDSAPAHYYSYSNVRNSVISNGCSIEGTVENSVIGRGCIIKKGAIVRNSVLSPQAIIGEDVHIEYAVVDKKARISRKKDVLGDAQNPLYVKRNDKI